MALFTFIFQAFKSFAYCSEFLMAVVYIVLGAMTVYYGEKISELFETKNKSYNSNANDTGKKLRIVSHSIGGIFILKGFCGLLTALSIFDDVFPTSIGANVWDFLVRFFLF